tara:strand:+ start:222 stop:566 length:345 start_codon:yes stop_codon:yes gene_type:complete
MKKLFKNAKKYSTRLMFLFIGILLPLSIITLTLGILIEGLPNSAITFFIAIALIVLNIVSIFCMWLTFKTAPFKIVTERVPCIAFGIVYSQTRVSRKSLGLLLPFVAIGIEFTD